MLIMTDKLALQLDRPEFDRSRLRVYYGNMGEIIAQEVLRKQGFEVWLTKPVADATRKDYLRLLSLPKDDEEKLRSYYDNLPSFRKERETRDQFLKRHKEHIRYNIETVKANLAFFSDQVDSFKEYLKRLEKESITYSCDLVAKKDHEIYIIEVKSTRNARRFLRGKKLRGLMLAREYGFTPVLITFNLKIEASNFRMSEL